MQSGNQLNLTNPVIALLNELREKKVNINMIQNKFIFLLEAKEKGKSGSHSKMKKLKSDVTQWLEESDINNNDIKKLRHILTEKIDKKNSWWDQHNIETQNNDIPVLNEFCSLAYERDLTQRLERMGKTDTTIEDAKKSKLAESKLEESKQISLVLKKLMNLEDNAKTEDVASLFKELFISVSEGKKGNVVEIMSETRFGRNSSLRYKLKKEVAAELEKLTETKDIKNKLTQLGRCLLSDKFELELKQDLMGKEHVHMFLSLIESTFQNKCNIQKKI